MTDTRRWLPFLGAALIVEAVVTFFPWMSRETINGPIELPSSGGWIHPVNAFLLTFLGVATLILGLRKAVIARFFGLAGFSVAILACFQISYFVQFLVAYRSPQPSVMIQTLSIVLLSVGAAMVWGSAIAMRESPGSLAFQKCGRISGGLIQLGLVFAFVQEVLTASRIGFRGFGMEGSAVYGMFTLIRTAGRLLLLWCSIESVRGATEEAVILLRARRIHKLMTGWIGIMTLNAFTTTILWLLKTNDSIYRQSPYNRYSVWRGVVFVTLSLIAAFAIAKQLLASTDGYKSASAAHPSVGAET
jgi:hypothetical protein